MLYELLNALGLEPRLRQGGSRVAARCWRCHTAGSKKRTLYGYNDKIGTCWCFRCDPHGTVWNAYRLAKEFKVNYEGVDQDERPKREDSERVRINIPLAWSKLWGDRNRLRAFEWAIYRGWGTLAPAVSTHPCVLHINERPAHRGALALWNRSLKRPLLIALRSRRGEVINVSRRAGAVDRFPELPKSLQLSNRDAGTEFACFGRLNLAQDSDVILVEGAPDYILASLLFTDQVVIGAISASHQLRVAEELKRLRPGRVKMIPHRGDRTQAGERYAEQAALTLQGVVDVCMITLPSDGDLCDYYQEAGVGKVRRLVDRAVVTHRKDISLGDSPQVIKAELDEAYRSAGDEVQVIQVPPGVGKSFAALSLCARVAGQKHKRGKRGTKGRVVFLTENHALAEEMEAQFRSLYPETPSRHIKGLPQTCRVWNETAATYYRIGGRKVLCGQGEDRCEHWDTCDARVPKTLRTGEVTFSVHAMTSLSKKADLVIIDEEPAAIQTEIVQRDDVASLYRAAPLGRGKRWMDTEGRLIEADIIEAWDILEKWAVAEKTKEHGERAELAQLVGAERLARITAQKPPPYPVASALRKGLKVGESMPSVQAFMSLIKAQEEGVTAEVSAHQGQWSIELRSAVELPSTPVIILDATSDQTGGTLEQLSQRHFRRRVIPVMGATPRDCIWIKSGLYTAGSAHYDSARKRIESLMAYLKTICRGEEIGVISHKRLADQVAEWGLGEWGYYGRDDRGTNRFSGVGNWVCLGDPIPNIGTVQAECRLSGEDWEEVIRGRCYATAIQAIARARHIRRYDDPPRIIYVGMHPPPGYDWREERLPAPPKRRGELEIALEDIADALGVVPPVKWWLSHSQPLGEMAEVDLTVVSLPTLKRTLRRLRKGMRPIWDKGAGGEIYGRDPAKIQAWIDAGYPLPK